jgi:hypothetical protein
MTRQRSRARTTAAAVIALGVVAALPLDASAVESAVTLSIQDEHRFRGIVTSPAPACVIGRRVNLVRIEPDGSRTVVTHTFATESGHYATSIPMQWGNRFFARIRRFVTPGGKVCLGDRSPTRTV